MTPLGPTNLNERWGALCTPPCFTASPVRDPKSVREVSLFLVSSTQGL